jgi:hypothetical protein
LKKSRRGVEVKKSDGIDHMSEGRMLNISVLAIDGKPLPEAAGPYDQEELDFYDSQVKAARANDEKAKK